MKRKLPVLLFAVLFITGCRYKEGPLISSSSVEKRLTGTWQITEFTSNDIDSLNYLIDSCGSQVIIGKEYYDDSDLKIGLGEGKLKFGGSFIIAKNKKSITVSFIHTGSSFNFNVIGPFSSKVSEWEIKKLTYKEFKVVVNINNRNYNISFKRL
jgi:hypothetical protein